MISIIMPIYNGEKFIEKSIGKLLAQPYKDIEIILVNDGSTDSSEYICRKFASKDNRIKLISIANGGICNARNIGLSMACGEYISFIDQDDEIDEDIYRCLISGIQQAGDMVVGGKTMQLIDEKNNLVVEKTYEYSPETISGDEIIYRLFNCNRDMSMLHLWNCLYKREIIEKYCIRFDNQFEFGHEDTLFNFEYAKNCSNVVYVSGVVYKYYRRKMSSTSLKINENYLEDFKYFIAKASKLLNLDNKPYLKDVFFTYCIRLGISLFCQYSSGKNSHKKKMELAQIYEDVCKCCNSIHASSKGGTSIIHILFLKVICLFLRHKKYLVVRILLKLKRVS